MGQHQKRRWVAFWRMKGTHKPLITTITLGMQYTQILKEITWSLCPPCFPHGLASQVAFFQWFPRLKSTNFGFMLFPRCVLSSSYVTKLNRHSLGKKHSHIKKRRECIKEINKAPTISSKEGTLRFDHQVQGIQNSQPQ